MGPSLRLAALAISVVGAVMVGKAQAETLDAVRTRAVLRCGAAERVGFADAASDGRITGLGVDLCRALTIAVLGPEGRTEFHLYTSDHDYDAVRNGTDQVSFLTADAVVEHGLAASVLPGPPVFIAMLTVLARPGVSDTLEGTAVCFMVGSPAHQALEAWAYRSGRSPVRIGFQENAEMQDAFDAGHCGAITGEASELAAFRAGLARRSDARVLPPLALLPVFAGTSVQDGSWAGLVNWVMAALVQSGVRPGPWMGTSPGAKLAGLRPDWQGEVIAAVGDYPTMVARHLADDHWPNTLWPDGLLLPTGVR